MPSPDKAIAQVGDIFRNFKITGGRNHIGTEINYNYYSETHPNQAILTWLSPLNFSARQKDILHTYQQGTAQWFFQDTEFKKWFTGISKTLWCHGIPGAGKTVISSIVVEYLKDTFSEETTGVACIFCDRNSEKDQTASSLISSISKQLIQSQKDFPDNLPSAVHTIHEKHKRQQTTPSFHEHVDLLHEVIAGFSKVFIVIDALDECNDSDLTRKYFVQTITDLLPSSSNNIQIMVTSRNLPQIERTLKDWPKMVISADAGDIRAYLDAHLKDQDDLAEVLEEDESLREHIITTIQQMSQGMFLLARFQLNALLFEDNREDVLEKLSNLPQTLFESYDNSWEWIQKHPKRERSEQVLTWIVFALRPLKVKELQDALVIQAGDTSLNIKRRPVQNSLASALMGLVVVDQESQVIRLVHETTRAYFEERRLAFFPQAQKTIAEACLTYLSFETFDGGPSSSQKALDALLKQNNFLDYAARNWGSHARGDAEISLKNRIINYLTSDTKISSSGQILLRPHLGYSEYGPGIPRNITGMHVAAYFGLKLSIASMIKNGAVLDCKDNYGRTPLSYATELGHDAVVRLLLDTEVNTTLKKDDNLDINSQDYLQRTALSFAIKNGHTEVVRLLIECDNIDINSRGRYDETPLMLAAEKGYEDIFKLLLNHKHIYVNARTDDDGDGHGLTALAQAAISGQENIVSMLLKADGIKVDVESNRNSDYGRTPLSYAAHNGHAGIVQLLLDCPEVRVDSENHMNLRTPISYAAAGGSVAVVQLLLERKPELVDSRDRYGRSPLSYACAFGNEAVVRMLISRPDVNSDSRSKYVDPDRYRQKNTIYLDSEMRFDGRTPLSFAAENGHLAIVKLIIECDGVEFDRKDDYCGRTPLSYAAENGHSDVVLFLLEHGADPHSTGYFLDYGRMPLSYAAESGHEGVVRILLEKGGYSDVNSEDGDKKSPLDYAMEWGHSGVVQLLKQGEVSS